LIDIPCSWFTLLFPVSYLLSYFLVLISYFVFMLWLLPIAWGLCIIYLSLLPGGGGIMIWFGIPHVDKVLHFGGYGLLAFLAAFASYKQVGFSKRQLTRIAVICSILGIGLEVMQYVMQVGRSFEGLDMVANVLGVAAGLLFAPWRWKPPTP
jgi:hypothetical protein